MRNAQILSVKIADLCAQILILSFLAIYLFIWRINSLDEKNSLVLDIPIWFYLTVSCVVNLVILKDRYGTKARKIIQIFVFFIVGYAIATLIAGVILLLAPVLDFAGTFIYFSWGAYVLSREILLVLAPATYLILTICELWRIYSNTAISRVFLFKIWDASFVVGFIIFSLVFVNVFEYSAWSVLFYILMIFFVLSCVLNRVVLRREQSSSLRIIFEIVFVAIFIWGHLWCPQPVSASFVEEVLPLPCLLYLYVTINELKKVEQQKNIRKNNI